MFLRSFLVPSSFRSFATAPTPHPLVSSLRAAMKASMLARTPTRTTTIKSILADIQTSQHLAGSAPSPLKTLTLAISRRKEAASQFRQSDRTDLAEQYEQEIEVLNEFVPQRAEQLSPEKLKAVVEETLRANEITKAVGKDVGRIISLVRERVGDQADGKDISEAVRKTELA